MRFLRLLFSRTGLEVLLGLTAVGAFVVAIEANILTREGLRHGQIVGAWQVISTPAPGNTGKKDALELLHAVGQHLNGIDLSCARMSGQVDLEVELGFCDARVDLTGLTLNPIREGIGRVERSAELFQANLSGVDLTNSSLIGANLGFATLAGANIFHANLGEAHFYRADLSYAILSGVMAADVELENADLTRAYLFNVDFSRANFSGVNLSGTRFCYEANRTLQPNCSVNITEEQILSAWSWADRPPVIDSAVKPAACPISLRADYEERRFPSGRPVGC